MSIGVDYSEYVNYLNIPMRTAVEMLGTAHLFAMATVDHKNREEIRTSRASLVQHRCSADEWLLVMMTAYCLIKSAFREWLRTARLPVLAGYNTQGWSVNVLKVSPEQL